MADKGFTVEDLLPADVGLNMSQRVSTKKQMSHVEFFKTNSIASARIVVEMKMKQIKNYNILNSRLPISEAHLSEQTIFICTSLTNLLRHFLNKKNTFMHYVCVNLGMKSFISLVESNQRL